MTTTITMMSTRMGSHRLLPQCQINKFTTLIFILVPSFFFQERPRKRARSSGRGAIIESMQHHGKGVYSGTFSGTLNPALQDRNGQPKRDITTIIHILNDLLCAQYKNYQSSAAQGAAATPSAQAAARAAKAAAAAAQAAAAQAAQASQQPQRPSTSAAPTSSFSNIQQTNASNGKLTIHM